MRTLRIFLATAAFLLAGGVSRSHALASLDLAFTSHTGLGVSECSGRGRNTGNIVAGRAEGIGFGSSNSLCTLPGDTVAGVVLLNVDDDGAPGNADDDDLVLFIVSMVWDEVSGGPGGGASDSGNLQAELGLLSANELNTVSQGSSVLFPFNAGITSTQESTGDQRGEALEFESGTLDLGLRSGDNPYVIANFSMLVTSRAVTDGRDIFAGFFTGNDGFAFGSNTIQLNVTTVGLDVNRVPEPHTAGLLGLALLALTAIARWTTR